MKVRSWPIDSVERKFRLNLGKNGILLEVTIFFTPWPQDNANSLDPGIEYNASNTTSQREHDSM